MNSDRLSIDQSHKLTAAPALQTGKPRPAAGRAWHETCYGLIW
jgi:hypothetical protein